jgi:hypothetical protein
LFAILLIFNALSKSLKSKTYLIFRKVSQIPLRAGAAPVRAVSLIKPHKSYTKERMPLVNMSVTLYGVSFKVFDLANFKAPSSEKNKNTPQYFCFQNLKIRDFFCYLIDYQLFTH